MGSQPGHTLRMPGISPGKRPPGLDFFIINVGILGLFVSIIDGMSIGQHTLMQDTRN